MLRIKCARKWSNWVHPGLPLPFSAVAPGNPRDTGGRIIKRSMRLWAFALIHSAHHNNKLYVFIFL
jgi:hypothetical protein